MGKKIDFIRIESDGSASIYYTDKTCEKIPKEKVYDFSE